ncbi:Scr1 family TA system antitoxin-like transcriptional regulator [Streptomyces roseolus]|uniref:Scr1 family TA system antitoxin-like transcriptional regulator n=1 Tax=Streptomyces roseolus TaxID=67358 RepID=UPI003666E6D4
MVNRKLLEPSDSPEAAFGARLRRLREERGWKQEDLAGRTSYSGKHISAVETARRKPTLTLSKELDDTFGLTGRADSFEREWRRTRNGVLMEGFPEYAHHERRAVEIRTFEIGLVAGLLQVPEYAEALAAATVARGSVTADEAAGRVAFQMERQQILERDRPPMVFAVLDESCIRTMVGGPRVMAAQLDRLVEFAARPHTVLQVAPFAMGERRALNRLLTLLTLPDRSALAYTESQAQGYLEREVSAVASMFTAYHQLSAESLSQADTVTMIKEVRKGLL